MSFCTALARLFRTDGFTDALRQPFLNKAHLKAHLKQGDRQIVHSREIRVAHSSPGKLGRMRLDAIYHLLDRRVPYGSRKRDIKEKLAKLQASLDNLDGGPDMSQGRLVHPRFSMSERNRPCLSDTGSTMKSFVIPLASSGQEVQRSEQETMLHILLTQEDATALNIRKASSTVCSPPLVNAGSVQRHGAIAYEPPVVQEGQYTVFKSTSIDMTAMIDRLGIRGNSNASHIQKTISAERNLCWMRSSVVSIIRQYAMQPDGSAHLENKLRAVLRARTGTIYRNESVATFEADIHCLKKMVEAACVNLAMGGSGIDPVLVDRGPNAGMLMDPSAADQSTGIANGEGAGLRLMMALLEVSGTPLPKIGEVQDEVVVTQLHRMLDADSVIQNIYRKNDRTKADATVVPENCSIYMSSQRQGSQLKDYIDQAMQETAFSGHAMSAGAASASRFCEIARHEDMTMLVNYGGHYRVFVLKRP
jgi:hypothetical protein